MNLIVFASFIIFVLWLTVNLKRRKNQSTDRRRILGTGTKANSVRRKSDHLPLYYLWILMRFQLPTFFGKRCPCSGKSGNFTKSPWQEDAEPERNLQHRSEAEIRSAHHHAPVRIWGKLYHLFHSYRQTCAGIFDDIGRKIRSKNTFWKRWSDRTDTLNTIQLLVRSIWRKESP